MRRFVSILSVLAFVGVVACGGGNEGDATRKALQLDADKYAIAEVETTWHKATTLKDIDLMMSLWHDDGIMQVGDLTYTGKAQVRQFFETTASPFKPENNWLSDHPAYKMIITVDGDKGTLYFECHFVDVKTREVKAVVAADLRLERVNGNWLITHNVAATPILSA